MSEKLEPLPFGQKEESMLLGRDFLTKRDGSDQVALEIDLELKRFVTENYVWAKGVLTEHMASLRALAEALLEEVMDAPEIDEIILQSFSQAAPA